MRVLLDRLEGFAGLLLLALMLVGWGSGDVLAAGFTSPGGGSGGFTGRPLITVEISADKTNLQANLAGNSVDPSLPYTNTITVVVKQDGRLFPAESVAIDLPEVAIGSLLYLDGDSAHENENGSPKAYRRLTFEKTSGIVTGHFTTETQTGTATIIASVQDPNTKQVVSASVQITVVAEARPANSITFTGPYVNAVFAGQSRFGTPPIQNGAYSRVVSVVVNDANGRPTNPNTKINFFLIDGPITGYPANPGAFFIAGNNGDPQENGLNFSAPGGQFLTKDVRPLDRLVLNGGQYRTVQAVIGEDSLTIQSSKPFGPDSRTAIPYVIGHAENATILSPSFTDLTGVASTVLTYPVTRIGQTAILMACTDDYVYCGMLNTCDINGANCKSVYLGVTNGADWVLTASATELGPNTTTPVKLCLKDPNFTPLAATAIRYDMSTAGVAKVKVNDIEGKQGQVLTGGDGCATVTIQSSGQPPGSKDIVLSFIADNIPAASAVKITIKAPGEGKIDGVATCQVTSVGSNKGDPPTPPTAVCNVTMQLVDDNFSPLAGVLITLGDGTVPEGGLFSVAFSPAEGRFGKTDDKGVLAATVNFTGAGAFSIPFKLLNGAASYTLKFTVPKPTDKPDDDTTTDSLKISTTTLPGATAGTFYTALLEATGGKKPYTWSILSGALPGGLSLDPSTGVLSGTPNASGTSNFVVKVTDGAGATSLVNLALVVVAKGGGDSGGPATASVTLKTSSPQLNSSGTPPVTLTATVRDSNNVIIAGKTVDIIPMAASSPPAPENCNSTSYQLRFIPRSDADKTPAVTDASGTVKAELTTGSDPTLRCIGMVAVSDGVTSTPVTWVQVAGTGIQITGPDTAILNQNPPPVLTLKLADSDGNPLANQPLTVSSTPAGRVSPASVTTGFNGQATVTVDVSQPGAVTVTVTGAGVTTPAQKTVTISADQFAFTAPDPNQGPPQVNLNTDFPVTVQWLKAGVPQAGPVTLTLTRGVFTATGTSTQTVNVVNGTATVTVRAGNAGPSVVTAATQTTPALVAQTQVQFIATTPSRMTIQATPAVIGTNPAGSTGEQSTISVVLRDGNNNLVANQTVNFTLIDVTGGALAPSSAITTLLGDAQSVYTSSAASSAQNGVAVLATVAGAAVPGFSCTAPSAAPASTIQNLIPSPLPVNTCLVAFTVAKKQLFIKLGTGNKIEELSPTQYAFPYNVLVTDAAGRPIKGATVELIFWPARFFIGHYCFNTLSKPKWTQKIVSPTTGYGNEDANRNGILDPGEDKSTSYTFPKGDNVLNPGNVATVTPSTVVTGDDGSVAFKVIYSKQYAEWVDVELTARAKVSGSEATDLATFRLPILYTDKDSDSGPAGNPSPFGDEAVPTCP
ncbi:MAG TPA: Ig-like domain-containing protein [Candidatus Contendobacter sp.]|nr:Ig-like domain-containing protein [Candidatus Contendobacter sp.]HRD48252.1 Ig-like domain-containing protein [Candidatus Contendobacter sp.]